MNGPALVDEGLPCTCTAGREAYGNWSSAPVRPAGVYRRDPSRPPGQQFACTLCGGTAPLQPGPASLDPDTATLYPKDTP